ncbi:MAG TPA: SO2930 family diheme c-type cytochrome [Leptospiraceae bacterium]|nr:SO2930 family diheme c-type cytochrome [Leptospiraceae bacterium]HNN74102.1 SO2930 family diheme c-type cytochrome [Leptospiraceae bacterium]
MKAIALVLLVAAFSATGCKKSDGVQFYDDNFPAKLSDWKLFVRSGENLTMAAGLIPYDLNSPLFSDYARKFRTVYVPPGKSAEYTKIGVLNLPVGTILSKTFYYPRKASAVESSDFPSMKENHVIETRLLVHTSDGWVGLPYIWNKEGTEATLEITGGDTNVQSFDMDGKPIAFKYSVPNQGQCSGCHSARRGEDKVMTPIGPKARQLNKVYAYKGGPENQIDHWKKSGILNVPADAVVVRNAVWNDPQTGTVEERARAYLDVNCAHCHIEYGPANQSGLILSLENQEPHRFGVCKSPTAAGRASANMDYDIVPGNPDSSILIHRMTSTEAGIRMPELARSLLHKEGLSLVREWVKQMKGNCN